MARRGRESKTTPGPTLAELGIQATAEDVLKAKEAKREAAKDKVSQTVKRIDGSTTREPKTPTE